MKIYRTAKGIIIENQGKYFLTSETNWDAFVNRNDLYEFLTKLLPRLEETLLTDTQILAPLGSQEVWAAGVTYMRSREARMEESKESGAAVFYSHVYEAPRPELFFKSTASRVVGPNEPVRIRKDSKWNVPEPELTLFITSSGSIVGYTIGNDMSSRDIEGENPLYLPQAKCYDGSAAVGPALYVPGKPIDPDTSITLEILRQKNTVFKGQISINQMKRKHNELVDYLFREMSFPQGVFLMTGTCLVPPDHFTLEENDVVRIEIGEIGVLENNVKQ
ncbi:MAG: fumarylacetoacetate hydrolase family protein [Cyclobacteriaceae bacterium]|nr:fumarylacetoacetate hydrolase family protein [Cyclobacteriaceae bacterium]